MVFRLIGDGSQVDVCPASVAKLMIEQRLLVRGSVIPLELGMVQRIERVPLRRSASSIVCDHHRGFLGACPDAP